MKYVVVFFYFVFSICTNCLLHPSRWLLNPPPEVGKQKSKDLNTDDRIKWSGNGHAQTSAPRTCYSQRAKHAIGPGLSGF